MKKFLIVILSSIFTFSIFAMPEGKWWVPECNSSEHSHEYEEGYFELCYDEDYEQPMFVSYQLSKSQILGANLKRKDNFREDTRISTGSATLSDYRNSGYSRGHLAKRGDFAWDSKAQDATFLMSNMSPQEQNYFNGGIWLKVEDAVTDMGKNYDYTYVVTGPILDKKDFKTIGTNKVAVPEDFYKIAVFVNNDRIVESFAVIMSQTNKLAPKANKLKWDDPRFIVTIKDIEKRTGIDFFKTLDDSVETYLENYKYGSGKSFIPQELKLDNSKVVKNINFKKATDSTKDTTVKEESKNTIKDAKENIENETININLVDETFLKQKLNNRMYLKNIAKNSNHSIEDVFYSIGYYGLEDKLVNYCYNSKTDLFTYEDKTSKETFEEAIKKGNSVSDKNIDLNSFVDDYNIKKEIENKTSTVEEIAEIYGMTKESVYVKLGILKAKL